MPTGTIELQKPVQQEVDSVDAHTKGFIELIPSFEGLLAPKPEMLLGRLLDGRLRVVEPFVISLTAEEGQFIAEAREVSEVGVGSTQSEALRDLQATLGELYAALERDQNRLGIDLAGIFEVMKRKVTRRT